MRGRFFRNIRDLVRSTFLCIRYPFLYPRNRFTGLHYNNWKIIEKIKELYKSSVQPTYFFFTHEDISKKNISNTIDIDGDVYYISFNYNDDTIKVEKIFSGTIYSTSLSSLLPEVNDQCGERIINIGFDLDAKSDKYLRVLVQVVDGIRFNEDADHRFIPVDGIVDQLGFMYYKLLKFYHDKVLQVLHCFTTFTEADSFLFGDMKGWGKAFGDEFLRELKKDLKEANILYKFRITDWKEKYGEMRLYCNFATKKIYALIDRYTEESRYICIECGKPAKYRTSGWILPYCEECFKKNKYSDIDWTERKKPDGTWEYNEELP
jgi:hypothetical protein